MRKATTVRGSTPSSRSRNGPNTVLCWINWKKSPQVTEKPVSQLAINYLAQKSFVSNVIVGAKRPDQIEENAKTMEWKLSDSDMEQIETYYQELILK